jgi:hypothetical protein
MLQDKDHVLALRARILNKRTVIEERHKREKQALEIKHQHEIQAFEDMLATLGKAADFLLEGDLVEKEDDTLQPLLTRTGLMGALRHVLGGHPGVDADPIHQSYIKTELKKYNLEPNNRSLYVALRREAAAKDGLIIHIKGQGFYLARDKIKAIV